MERTDGLLWLVGAGGAGASLPWLPPLMLAAGLALLALVIAGWRRRARLRVGGQRTGVREQQEMVTEVGSLVRALIADLDARADRLERLIAEADRRLERGARAEVEAKPARAGRIDREETDPMARRIYGLADEGLPVVEIARRLEQPTGKVELILALRGR